MRRRVGLIVVLALACSGEADPTPARTAPDPAVKPAPAPVKPVPDKAATDTGPVAPSTAPARRLWIPAIRDGAEFDAYSKEIGGERFTKFVIDLRTDAIYYFDVDVYRVHKDFVFAELYKKPRSKPADRAFDRNYAETKPEFLLCYLVHHLNGDVWTMAFWEGDRMTPHHVAHAYRRMRETFYLGHLVKFRPDSTRQEKIAGELDGVPVITNDRLYRAASYQAFNPGRAVGRLRIVAPVDAADAAELTFSRDEIVILPESLPDITPVAGILSETFSTPLSHVSLRARAWGIPNVGLKGAAERYRLLDGKIVWFEATPADHLLREATADEIAAREKKRAETAQVAIPPANLDASELRPLGNLRAADARAYGAKASNLGEIMAGGLTGFTVPDGFAIPIRYYDAHLRAAGIDKLIAEMLDEPRFRSDASHRKRRLAVLRQRIIDAPLDPALTEALAGAVDRLHTAAGGPTGLFVRSSTNAEDLPGFNGAGLYDTVPNVIGPEALARAIKQVWSSVWNLRAYEERQHYAVDHRQVHGAVLVQIGIDATAAGVLITAHPTDPTETTTYTINAKRGLGMKVVEGVRVPESLLYDHHNDGLRVLSRSDEETLLVFDPGGGVREVPNPERGTPVLTDARARALGRAARAITRLFPRNRPLDIEWLFRGDELFIVQARPYVVR